MLFDTGAPLSLAPSLKRSWDSWEGATEHVHFQASRVFTPFAGHYDRHPTCRLCKSVHGSNAVYSLSNVIILP